MTEEILEQTSVSGKETGADNNTYIDAINEMRKNTVNRSEYEKLQEENRKLLNSLINGDTIDLPVEKEPVDINKLREDLFLKEHNNLEYAKMALELRSALIERGEEDPFLPKGHGVQLTQADYDASEKVATAFQHCIDYAQGDSEIFTTELMRITQDNFRPNLTKTKRR